MSEPNDCSAVASLSGVTKTYGHGPNAVHALKCVNLEIESGRMVMLVGPSGCGKTTLIAILSGLMNPTDGDVEICGIKWSRFNEDEKTRMRGSMIGYVFQNFHLIPTLPIIFNVAVPLLARGVKNRQAMERAAESLNDLGLGNRLKAMPSDLSGGMQQRVAIARALVGQPRLLVCDEPTANLDRETGESVMQLLHDSSRLVDDQGRPRGVVVVTHDYRALRFADLIYEIEDGHVRPALAEFLMQVWKAAISQHDPISSEIFRDSSDD